MSDHEIGFLVGKVLSSVENRQNEQIVFTLDDGKRYMLYHEQDCCESVSVEDVVGDLNDLVGSPILRATEDANERDRSEYGSCTWTFYNIATAKGHVTIRWYGASNGYYSESVSFGEYTEPEHYCQLNQLEPTGEQGGDYWESNDIGSEHWYIPPYQQYKCPICGQLWRRTRNGYTIER